MQQSAKTTLFLYGTLKRGGSNHRAMKGQTFIGNARTVPGFAMFLVSDYPGLVPWAEDREGISGELWEVDAAGLDRLDRLEGVDEGLYRREPVSLQHPFADRIVDTYIYAQPVEGLAQVGSDWPV